MHWNCNVHCTLVCRVLFPGKPIGVANIWTENMALGEILIVERQRPFRVWILSEKFLRLVPSTKGCEDAGVLTTHPLFFLYYSNTAIPKHHLGVALTTVLEMAGTFNFYGVKGSMAPRTYIFYLFSTPTSALITWGIPCIIYEMMLPSCGKLNLPYGLLGA